MISSDDDPASADAADLVREARPAFEAHNCGELSKNFVVRGSAMLCTPWQVMHDGTSALSSLVSAVP